MEQVVNAVPAVCADDRAAVRPRDGLTVMSNCKANPSASSREKSSEDVHGLAKVTEKRTGLAELDGLIQALACGAHEPFGVVVDPADGVSLVQVPMVACAASRLSQYHVRYTPTRQRASVSPSLYSVTSANLMIVSRRLCRSKQSRRRNTDIDNVALLELPLVGNAMADHLIHGPDWFSLR